MVKHNVILFQEIHIMVKKCIKIHHNSRKDTKFSFTYMNDLQKNLYRNKEGNLHSNTNGSTLCQHPN